MMKTIFIFSAYVLQLCFFMMSLSSRATAQEAVLRHENKVDFKDSVFFNPEVMPEFPEGNLALRKFIAKNVKYPPGDFCVNGSVFVRCAVMTDGRLDSVRIARSVHPLFDQEALRMVHLLPRWIPARNKGQLVPAWALIRVPILFEDDPDSIYTQAEVMPQFPGGEQALKEYIINHLQYPKEYIDACISGKLQVSFVVGATGLVEKVCLERPLDRFIDEEAMRVVAMMPRWKPASDHGKAVDAWCTIPIHLFLE